jgi:hypothetical protein
MTVEARLDAVSRYYRAQLGENAGQAKAATLRTFGDLANAEREIAAALPSLRNTVKAPASPPAVAATPQGAQPTEPGKVDEATYQRMSHAERLDYARAHSRGNG